VGRTLGWTGLIAVGIIFTQIVMPTLAHADHADASAMLSSEVRRIIPSGSIIIPEGANKALFLSVDMNRNGRLEYAVLYRYKHDGTLLAGAMIFDYQKVHIQKLWQDNGLVMPVSVWTVNLFNNGSEEVAFKGGVGAMANYYDILADNNGHVRSIFNSTAYRLDIGDFSGRGIKELATWTQDVGNSYSIHLYGWNSRRRHYQEVPNNRYPEYFKDTVIPYYNALRKTKNAWTRGISQKGIDYELASAYYDAGQYQQSLSEIANGLKISNNDYPPDSEFLALKRQVERSKSS